MTAKEKAQQLVVQYKSILMDENTNCGEEILCTTIAKKIAWATVDEIQGSIDWLGNGYHMLPDNIRSRVDYWDEVKQEVENL